MENICRVCEKQTFFMDLSHSSNRSYLQQFLSCANVTVRIPFQKFVMRTQITFIWFHISTFLV